MYSPSFRSTHVIKKHKEIKHKMLVNFEKNIRIHDRHHDNKYIPFNMKYLVNQKRVKVRPLTAVIHK